MTLPEDVAALKRFAARGRLIKRDIEDMLDFLRHGGALLAEELRSDGLILPDPTVSYLHSDELGEIYYYRFCYEETSPWRDKTSYMVEVPNVLGRILGTFFWDDMEDAFADVFELACGAGLCPAEKNGGTR